MNRGFLAFITRTEHHSPNGGISADGFRVIIADARGNVESSQIPAVKLVKREQLAYSNMPYWHFEPLERPAADRSAYMASGALIQVSPDMAERLGLPTSGYYALHDRTEAIPAEASSTAASA